VSVDGGGGAGRAAAAGSPRSAGALYVHVAGAVRRPGLIRVPPGTRVATALERAGGPARRADLTLVNLAARVQDGQQIVVPLAGARPEAGGGSPAGAAAGGAMPGAKIHLSTATPEQLDEIDGIGPTLAGRIVEYRDTHGGFRSLDDLQEVEGIGEKRLATLREALQP
jgi:competence protein ComEA